MPKRYILWLQNPPIPTPQSPVSAYRRTMPDWSNPLELVKDAGKFASLCLRHIPDTLMLRNSLRRLSSFLNRITGMTECRDTREDHASGARVVHLGNNRAAPI